MKHHYGGIQGKGQVMNWKVWLGRSSDGYIMLPFFWEHNLDGYYKWMRNIAFSIFMGIINEFHSSPSFNELTYECKLEITSPTWEEKTWGVMLPSKSSNLWVWFDDMIICISSVTIIVYSIAA